MFKFIQSYRRLIVHGRLLCYGWEIGPFPKYENVFSKKSRVEFSGQHVHALEAGADVPLAPERLVLCLALDRSSVITRRSLQQASSDVSCHDAVSGKAPEH